MTGVKIDENNVFQTWSMFVRNRKPVHHILRNLTQWGSIAKLENSAPTELHVFASSGHYSYSNMEILDYEVAVQIIQNTLLKISFGLLGK